MHQSLLYSVDVNLHVSHVSITPVVLETHDQCVWLQATQTNSLNIREQRRSKPLTMYLWLSYLRL